LNLIPRLLSIAGPLWVYASLIVLVSGLWTERRRLDWLALVPSIVGITLSVLFVAPVHRLFFDEDIYINIAGNLSHAPVNQVTLLGGPYDVQVSSYYKEPPGWPVLLSLVFLITGPREWVAFWVARILFGLTIAAVFHFAREFLKSRNQALIAAILFGATPICFWSSASAGTDLPAALFSALGMWGVLAGNGALAASGLAMAAQTRMELLILLPLLWLPGRIPRKWKLAGAALVVCELAHLAWVMAIAPVLVRAERIQAAFSPSYILGNLAVNIRYLFNPYTFFALITVLALAAVFYEGPRRTGPLILPAFALFCVYIAFYAGSFDVNPRYSIQILAPLTVLAASFLKGRRTILLLLMILPYTRSYELPGYVQALAADHRISAEFASQINSQDLVLSAQPEVFLNQGVRAMNSVFASEHREQLEAEIGRRKVWYHAGIRTNAADTQDFVADRWVKSAFELHLVRSQEISGMRIAFYEVLLKHVNREARLRRPFESERDRGE